MRPNFLALAVFSAAALATPVASAVTCYLLLDRNDNVVYQDIFPPFDLSPQGEAERKAMRARNEHMIAMETDRCPRLELSRARASVCASTSKRWARRWGP